MGKKYGVYSPQQGIPAHDAEIHCANDLVAAFGGSYRKSSLNEDKYQHYDIVYTHPNRPNKEYKFDVKMGKKIRRNNKDINYDYHWIEFTNGYGNNGWVYGKSDWIAFECETEWLFVETKILPSRIVSHMPNPQEEPKLLTTESSPEPYKWWKHNDFDEIVLVPTQLLKEIKKFSIPKSTI